MLELADLGAWQKIVAGLRDDLGVVLATAGFQAEPSDANFVLVRQAAGLRTGLAREGIVVRDCASFGLRGAVRIAVPAPEGLERLERALAAVAGAFTAGSARSSARSSSGPDVNGASAEAGVSPDERRRQVAGGRRVHPRPASAPPGMLTGALHICGTGSDAGKSLIVTGLCRLLAREGVRVAPFKAQNMSLNSFATSSGHEIGRARGSPGAGSRHRARSGYEPDPPQADERAPQPGGCERPAGGRARRGGVPGDADRYWPTVLRSLGDLRARFDVVICEGAGSPAEINLLDGDLVNLALAEAASIPAVLVGDIERGGVFASLSAPWSCSRSASAAWWADTSSTSSAEI